MAPAARRNWRSSCWPLPSRPPGATAVLNGRFKGGYITRHYGQPEQGIHAVQLELTQCSYMQETLPFAYLPERAGALQPTLQQLLQTALTWVQQPAQP